MLTLMSMGISTSFAWSTPVPTRSPKAPCRVDVYNPHISPYFIKTKETWVLKVNAQSVCDKPMKNLVIVIELYKTGHPFDHLLSPSVSKTYSNVPAGKIIRFEETVIPCKNFKSTQYFAVAYSQAVINGETWGASPVKSQIPAPIACGT